jgi:hypothetical protein
LESGCAIGSDSQDRCIALRELLIVISQSRQLRPAIWSKKTPQKDKHHRPPAIRREADQPSTRVAQLEIGGWLSRQ